MNALPTKLSKQEEAFYLKRMADGDPIAKQILIERNLRLVYYFVNKYKKGGRDNEELLSIGTIGLIKAIQTFDLSKNVQLSTYASRCIQNELLMHFRKSNKLKESYSLNAKFAADQEGNETCLLDTLSLREESVEEQLILNENLSEVRKCLETLKEKEKMIVKLRFGIDCTPLLQSEISEILHISQSYISRIEKQALRKLKKKLLLIS